MGSSQQLYSLAWQEFGTSLANAVQLLRSQNDLIDVTISAGGKSFAAHKLVLSAASPFLLELLKDSPCKHTVVLLDNMNSFDLEAILEFIYKGEVNVDPIQLPSLLQSANCLSIQGLAPGAIHPDVGKFDDQNFIFTQQEVQEIKESSSTCIVNKKKRKRKVKRKSTDGDKKRRRRGTSNVYRSDSDVISHTWSENYLSGLISGAKIKGASDQPTTCPLCGATLRQARNLRRHLEMLHFGANKIPTSVLDNTSSSTTNNISDSNSSSLQSMSPVPSVSTTSDQQSPSNLAASLCQPVMITTDDQQERVCVIPTLLPPPVITENFLRYQTTSTDQQHQLLRTVELLSDTNRLTTTNNSASTEM